jgi:4-oxalmesaconate hydratase
VSLRRFWFDTVLHYPPSLELLLRTVGPERVLFGTEKPGSGSAPNPATGRDFDDIRPVIEGFDFLTESDRAAVFEHNARAFFPALKSHLTAS